MVDTSFRLPSDDERVTIIGSTGSGKTIAGLWQLSLRDFDVKPWVILDFKGDRAINNIPNAKEFKHDARKLPDKPGIYITHPGPGDGEAVDELLWKMWHRENIGLFVDEGYMLEKSKAFRALLTQGRSKRIPIITLAQRPVWLDRFVISEANYLHLMKLHDIRDRMTVQPLLPEGVDYVRKPIEQFHSVWVDVARQVSFALSPVPTFAKFRNNFGIDRKRKRFL